MLYLKFLLFIYMIFGWLCPIEAYEQAGNNGFSTTQNELINKISSIDISFLEKKESTIQLLKTLNNDATVRIIGQNGTLLNILQVREFFSRLKFMEYGSNKNFEITMSSSYEITLKYY